MWLGQKESANPPQDSPIDFELPSFFFINFVDLFSPILLTSSYFETPSVLLVILEYTCRIYTWSRFLLQCAGMVKDSAWGVKDTSWGGQRAGKRESKTVPSNMPLGWRLPRAPKEGTTCTIGKVGHHPGPWTKGKQGSFPITFEGDDDPWTRKPNAMDCDAIRDAYVNEQICNREIQEWKDLAGSSHQSNE